MVVVVVNGIVAVIVLVVVVAVVVVVSICVRIYTADPAVPARLQAGQHVCVSGAGSVPDPAAQHICQPRHRPLRRLAHRHLQHSAQERPAWYVGSDMRRFSV